MEGRTEDEKDFPRGPQPWPEAPQGPDTPDLTLGPDLDPKARDTGAGATLASGLHTAEGWRKNWALTQGA